MAVPFQCIRAESSRALQPCLKTLKPPSCRITRSCVQSTRCQDPHFLKLARKQGFNMLESAALQDSDKHYQSTILCRKLIEMLTHKPSITSLFLTILLSHFDIRGNYQLYSFLFCIWLIYRSNSPIRGTLNPFWHCDSRKDLLLLVIAAAACSNHVQHPSLHSP